MKCRLSFDIAETMDIDHDNGTSMVNEDRLSNLPDVLIHKILACMDTKFVVQTCILSSRWKLLWTSMPFLNFSSDYFGSSLPKFSKFVTDFLSHRNHQIEVYSINLRFHGAASQTFVSKIAEYAFSHNVQELTINSRPRKHHEFPPSLFSSQSLKHFTFSTHILAPCHTPKTLWDFPSLITMHLSEVNLCDINTKSLDLFSKCVNLKNLTLKRFFIEAVEIFDIITPRLTNLMLIQGSCSHVINVIAPQLENLTIIDCSIKYLNAPPGLSSLSYKGSPPPLFNGDRFHSLNKVSVTLGLYPLKAPHEEVDARETIDMLQQLHSARYLTLDVDIVERISSFPNLLSRLPSPFSNLICLNIDLGTREDAYKVNMRTEVRNFLLGNSPTATVIVDLPKGPPTIPTKHKEAMEKKRAEQVVEIENHMKELEALLDQETRFVERKQDKEKTKVALENLVAELQAWNNKKMMQSEPEKAQIEEVKESVGAGLMARIEARVGEMRDLVKQEEGDAVALLSKKNGFKRLSPNLPKQMRIEIEARYSRQLEETKAQFDRLVTEILFSKEIIDTSLKSIQEVKPPSSSSAIIPTPSTSNINPMP